MKKMLLATALALLITGCAQRGVYYSKSKPTAMLLKETITHHFFRFWNWAENVSDAAKICGGAENVVKQKPSKHS